MRERESSSSESLFFFGFICPQERLEEACNEFRRIGGISISAGSFQKRVSHRSSIGYTDKAEETEGIVVSGIAFGKSLNRLSIALAERGIAGHSDEAQILYGKGDIVRPNK